ncbi:uroporphyrinogen decarboxylase family protein [Treponema sp. HNW]|uniref:uroporphyrinogen decarboxylase family protein n=1 Tax=Treponema sp. HNW TaxID=3116654 RepID=UPI003D15115D
MTKHERVCAAVRGEETDYTPSCFSLHFPKEEAEGERAVAAHTRFFKETDTDILKIMNENLLPDVGDIRIPDDWKKIPLYSLNAPFFRKQLDMTKRILDTCGKDAFTLGTIHGICASSIHPIEHRYGYVPVRRLVCTHLREHKQPVLDAFKRITEAMCLLARAYIELGVDAVYYAALGAEKHFFNDEEFAEFYAPFDREILSAVKRAGGITFLHMCKENLDLNRYANYMPMTDVVNWGIAETGITLEQGRKLFPNKTVLGGLANRSGVLINGTTEEITNAVQDIIRSFGKTGFILGADCTLPTEIPYNRIYTAVTAARTK